MCIVRVAHGQVTAETSHVGVGVSVVDQHRKRPSRFLVLSSDGVCVLEKRSPVCQLRALLQCRADTQRVASLLASMLAQQLPPTCLLLGSLSSRSFIHFARVGRFSSSMCINTE